MNRYLYLPIERTNRFFVVLYCNFRSLAFLGLLGFLIKAAKNLIFSCPLKCSQELSYMSRISKQVTLEAALSVRPRVSCFSWLGGYSGIYLGVYETRGPPEKTPNN